MKWFLKYWLAEWGRRIGAEQLLALNDNRALARLPSLGRYIPWTRSAINPSSVEILLNEIMINKRHLVLECGIGISTLYMASLMKDTGGVVTGIEHDEAWIAVVSKMLEDIGVPASCCRLIHAPLVSGMFGGRQHVWYDTAILERELDGSAPCDLLLVDGPISDVDPDVRFPAFPVLRPFLAEDFVVYLHDVRRRGEQRVAERWCREYDLHLILCETEGNLGIMRSLTMPAGFNIV